MKRSRSATALWMRASGSFLNLIYPVKCPLCQRVLKNPKDFLCRECERKLRPIGGPRCFSCGKPVPADAEYCRECAARPRKFAQGKGIFLYGTQMKNSLLRYKTGGCRDYARFYGRAMYVYGRADIRRWRPDILTPVPLTPAKRRARGFNQSEYLARELSRYTGIPVADGLVKKIKRTKSQKTLDARRRRQNLKEAFAVTEDVKGLRILVIDDVYTTGSTVEAMAERLTRRGAEKVFFLTICQGITG